MDLFTQDTENQEVTEINSSNTSGITTDNQVVTELNDKNKKKFLKMGDIKFYIKGVKEYRYTTDNNDERVWGEFSQIFEVSAGGDSIYTGYIRGMNVDRWGSKYVYLYTFDMLKNKTTGKIAYSEITIID
tara:strand:- start:638 stop:1027 length:390 start_codon:yes stop_codon:yes gene_type:complete